MKKSLPGKFLFSASALVVLLYNMVYFFRLFDLSAATFRTGIIAAACLGLGFAALWQWKEKQWPGDKIYFWLEYLLRYSMAYLFAFYALGKFFDVQFNPVPDEVLRAPASELSGLWKAWLFFGHSYPYQLFLAIAESLVALMLLFRSTQTAGALLFLGIMANITFMDFTHGVESMKITALVYGLICLVLLSGDAGRIFQFFLNRPAIPQPLPSWNNPVLVKRAGLFFMLLFFILVARDLHLFRQVGQMN